MAAGDPSSAPLAPAAARRLGLEPGVALEAARATIFRRLRDVDFLPDPATHDAVMLLCGHPAEEASLLAGIGADEEMRLRSEVEALASGFFDVPVGDRRRRWDAMVQTCADHEGLRDRLRGLTPGLDIDRASFAGQPPVVARLADDLFTLFVLRPVPRAALSRDLASRFWTDPSLSDRERARACRELQRRLPEVAALSHGYLAQLAEPRRRLWAARSRARVAGWLDTPTWLERATMGCFIMCVVGIGAGCFGFWFLVTRNPSPPPGSVSPNAPLQSKLFLSPGETPSPQFARYLRDQLKNPLRRELEKLGKRPDEPALQKILDALPADAVPQTSLASLLLSGQWSQAAHDRCVAGLKEALASSDLGLTESEIDTVALGTVPKASPSRSRSSRGSRTPGVGSLRREAP